jgi:uncharacterized membrane protein
MNFWIYAKDYPWFRGSMYRMMLGTFGGAVLAGLYEHFSSMYEKQ